MSDIKIPYVEIRDKTTLGMLGIIEGAEIFFEYAYHGVGDFEIYCRSTPNSRKLLVRDNLVTLPSMAGENEDNAWLIERIEKTNDSTGGRFIIAKGREAKILVNRRIVRYTTVLIQGALLTREVRDKLLAPNIIDPKDASRRFENFILTDMVGANAVNATIDDTAQVTWDNLYEYTEALYQTYGCAAKLRLNKAAKKLAYSIYKGEDKRGKVVFSQANENLLSSEYIADYTNYKTSVIVGGEEEKETVVGEDGVETEVETGIRAVVEIPCAETGYDRREVFIDAKDLQREYEDESGAKQTLTESEYQAALKQRGLEKKAEEHSANVTFTGDIDTTSTRYKFGRDYNLGDIVTNRDEDEKISVPVRVAKVTRVQNSEGYKEYFESEEVENVE